MEKQKLVRLSEYTTGDLTKYKRLYRHVYRGNLTRYVIKDSLYIDLNELKKKVFKVGKPCKEIK